MRVRAGGVVEEIFKSSRPYVTEMLRVDPPVRVSTVKPGPTSRLPSTRGI